MTMVAGVSNKREDLTFELKVQPVHGDGDAQAWVSWCLSPEIIAFAREQNYGELFMVIVVGSNLSFYADADPILNGVLRDMRETKRYVVPLANGKQLVGFSSSGANLIKAAIYRPSNMKASHMEGLLLERSSSTSYERTLLSEFSGYDMREAVYRNGDQLEGGACRLGNEASQIIEVDKRFFAKPPSRFLKSYVEKFPITRKAFDQCDFRRQLCWTVPLLPFFLVLRTLMGVLMLGVFGLYGSRGIKVVPLFRPFTTTLEDIDTDIPDPWRRSSRWFYKAPKDLGGFTPRAEARPWPFWFFNPMTIMLLWSVLSAVKFFDHPNDPTGGVHQFSYIQLLGVAVLLHVGFLIALALLVGCIVTIAWSAHGINRLFRLVHPQASKQQKQAMLQKEQARAWTRQEEQLQALVCGPAATATPGASGKPEYKPPLAVRFQGVKAKVCRPFPR